MKQEDRLKIQAWLDGELAPQESARIADLIDRDLEARELANDLRAVKKALEIGENKTVLDDTREFYWSQVERQIEAEEPISDSVQPELATGTLGNVLRWLIPVGSLAAISALMLNFGEINNLPDPGDSIEGEGVSNPTTTPPADTSSGFSENTGAAMEEESSVTTPEVGVFSFEGTQNGGNFASPEDPNTLPESIENPER